MDDSKLVIRVFNEERDQEMVTKLERKCKIGSKGISMFTNMMGDPLCRIRFYPVRVMLVAELLNNGELVGMVGGCIKIVGTGSKGRHVKLGCILGLRVSPKHRRMGIGLKLVQCVEEWMVSNGASYTFLASEEKNLASANLFTLKCGYATFASLVIFVHPVCLPAKEPSCRVEVEKLPLDQAISSYKKHLGGGDLYPADFEAILKEKSSIGTFKAYNVDTGIQSSWISFSMWSTCGTYKLDVQRSPTSKFLHATLNHARNKIFPCLNPKMQPCDSLEKPFGFLFLYGLHGEGERVGELMQSIWIFASGVAETVKDCKAIITELGFSDPLREHVPKVSSVSCIEDLWYLKKVIGPIDDEDDLTVMRPVGSVFVDPRDF
ncbi:hypothetical protein RJ639_022064 [Escallonia herrerae]|uniref:N-acetyltransferase domain-containing protein n=1 Tax=Escallonia herrerae TaxID=1293975 RepID=A0AA88V675_9ASTE|nr:hypothetical protein RJ639_022064 [Escallonia herrerae]